MEDWHIINNFSVTQVQDLVQKVNLLHKNFNLKGCTAEHRAAGSQYIE